MGDKLTQDKSVELNDKSAKKENEQKTSDATSNGTKRPADSVNSSGDDGSKKQKMENKPTTSEDANAASMISEAGTNTLLTATILHDKLFSDNFNGISPAALVQAAQNAQASGQPFNIASLLGHGLVSNLSRDHGDGQMGGTGTTGDVQSSTGGRGNTRNLTADERRQRRLARNRIAAKECRKKKKVYVQGLEEQVARLQEENQALRKEIEELHTKLALGAMRVDDSMRLIKEVEELNAKLQLTGTDGFHAHSSVTAPTGASRGASTSSNESDEEETSEKGKDGQQRQGVSSEATVGAN
ncbi:uncharacterized protein VTP21DRAFT_8331 [Calcarisporiella thermophila]|uniref:uncharacterized protein n=1 Tax=Calcarisporiella thermophila TaxID=911321 RepID=UPI003744585F